jgi:hypothetical protein
MTNTGVNVERDVATPAYARFTRRVQGVYIDLIVMILIFDCGAGDHDCLRI